MRARVPQDVDLEDRLLFGLTATRFGEVALAALAALAAWRLVPWVGGAIGVLLVVIGAILGWGRWRGRSADHWIVSVVLFAIRTRRIEVDQDAVRKWHASIPKRPEGTTVPAAAAPTLHTGRRPALRVLDGPIE